MKKTLLALTVLAAAGLLLACFDSNKVAARPAEPTQQKSMTTSFFQFTVNALSGEPVALEQFRGKKIIVLNVASKCGYTPQYADWEKYFTENKDNVVVLGFPCNDFMGQEPGSAEEIADFCQKNYGVSFPMFEKLHVKGDEKAPLYQWLTDPAQNGWNSQEPTWNFCKYLINEKGELTHFFASKVKPDSPEFQAAIGS
ncbi:MAG: glutathione peroxidase [Lewinellaceae bacterium]|nr:glutathione peroxidase [Saprospiraceae bacterium]MCB9316043.1 glutathione peroxidase [Lewinellaceae bacterium]MCB9330029.1 glutathione peroxidase [Lewinellaceae bacterium]